MRNAMFSGFAQAARRWPLVAALWLASLITVLPFALLPGIALLDLAARPAIAAMTDGLDPWQWIDLVAVLRQGQNAGLPGSAALRPAFTSILLAAGLLVPLGGLVSAFLYGGVLFSLLPPAPTEPPRDEPLPGLSPVLPPARGRNGTRRFLQGAWRWLGTFAALAVLQYLAAAILFVPAVFFGLVLVGMLGSWGPLLALPIGALMLASLAIFEQARVQCVLNDTRSPFAGLGAAGRALSRRPLAWLGLYALNLLGLFLLHLAFRGALLLAALAWGPAALLAQQVFIAGRLYFRVARLASSLALATPEMLSQSASPALAQS